MKKLAVLAAMGTAVSGYAAVDMYGFVKASMMMTDKQLTTTSGAEANHKPFFVGNTDGYTDAQKESTTQFSTSQSRWGIKASNGSKVSGKFEFDLDQGQTNGNASMSNARMRQANISYKISENGTLTLGKKWTKFMGLNPHSHAYTMVSFWSGNGGFLVDGFDYTHMFGNTSVALELANSGKEAVDEVSTPVTTLALAHKMGDHKFGLNHTMATLKYKALNDAHKDSAVSGTMLYWNGTYGNLDAKLEYTMGSNLGSVHTGYLAKATDANDDDIKETAYFLSLRYNHEDMGFYGGYGVDAFDKEEEAGDTKVSKNSTMRLGWDKKLDEGMTFFVEYTAFTTSYYSATDDSSDDSNGALTDIGFVYKF